MSKTIQVGDTMPDGEFFVMGEQGPEKLSADSLFKRGRVVLFGVPGAYTGTCTTAHLPGFVIAADDLRSKGVDQIACIAVNDIFVLNAWGKQNNAEQILMLADGNGDYARAMGLDVDLAVAGLGVRNQRFALVADQGKVSFIGVENAPPEHEQSSAEKVLAFLS